MGGIGVFSSFLNLTFSVNEAKPSFNLNAWKRPNTKKYCHERFFFFNQILILTYNNTFFFTAIKFQVQVRKLHFEQIYREKWWEQINKLGLVTLSSLIKDNQSVPL